MKTLRWSSFLMALLLGISLLGCKKDESTASTTVKTENIALSGSTAGSSGTFMGTYDKSTKVLTYSVNWKLSGNLTLMHFHGPAEAGQNASIALGITGFTAAAQGSYNGTATLTTAQETDMLAGKWYVNLHTAAAPAGEIRGTLIFK